MNGTATTSLPYARTAICAAAAVLVATLTGCAMPGSAAPARVSNGTLVDARGMSLYTYSKDSAAKSVCVAVCARSWRPLVATASDRAAGDYTIITRDDGSLQWAYKDRPLYAWIKDMKPGDRTGDGFDKTWSLARP